MNQLFTARRGKGAFYNNEKIQVSGKKDLSQALAIVEFGTARESKKLEVALENIKIILEACQG